MADGADYPGYPEPKPESKQRREKWKNPFIRTWSLGLDSFLESSKMAAAAVLGAFIGANIDLVDASGRVIPTIWDVVVIILFIHLTQHLIRIHVAEEGLSWSL